MKAPKISDSGIAELDALGRLWALRMLVRGRLDRHLVDRDGMLFHEALMEHLGLPVDPEARFSRKEIHDLLLQALSKEESKKKAINGVFGRNLAKLGKLLGLRKIDQEIIGFGVVAEKLELISEVGGLAGSMPSRYATASLIAVAIDRPRSAVESAISRQGRLHQAGLLVQVGNGRYSRNFEEMLEMLDGIPELLLEGELDPKKGLSGFFERAAESTLRRADFDYLATDYGIMVDLLKCMEGPETGALNILIHGPPGTGKSELARTLAREAGLSLHEVCALDLKGDEWSDEKRLAAYRFTQRALSGARNTAILVDEADALLEINNPLGFFMGTGRSGRKAALNKALETNRVPAIWVVNSIGFADPAFLRRFEAISELAGCPRSIRKRLLKRAGLTERLGKRWVDRAAEIEELTPALIEKLGFLAVKLDRGKAEELQGRLQHALEGFIPASSVRRELKENRRKSLDYDISYLNSDTEPRRIVRSVQSEPDVNILLSGPPGCGKTAFAKHIAEILDRPLLVYRASDLLNCYVGETEQNIQRMFLAADRENAILLLDEVDSFLFDRSGATRSWERTQVNELLTQIESFSGTFIAATNYVDVLDRALFRRFSAKVNMFALNESQRQYLFRHCLRMLKVKGPVSRKAEERLERLGGLTIGEFVVTFERVQRGLEGKPTTLTFLKALETEFRVRPDREFKGIGFTASVD